MRTYLVTGGAGFIGSHTVVELQQRDLSDPIISITCLKNMVIR